MKVINIFVFYPPILTKISGGKMMILLKLFLSGFIDSRKIPYF